MDKYQDKFLTSSLPLAATLLCLDIKLETVIKNEENKYLFVFIPSPKIPEIIQKYWKKAIKVEPNAYWESIRFLKSRIYGGGI